MPLDPSEVRLLAAIKYLYNLGIDYSKKPEPLNFNALLCFQDAIELFLGLAAQKLNVTKKSQQFMEYFEALDPKLSEPLSQKTGVQNLNRARVALKHDGIFPTKQDIVKYATIATNFFKENTIKIFGIDLQKISMRELLEDKRIKDPLEKANNLMQQSKLEESLEEIAAAFDVLIKDWVKVDGTKGRSIFPDHILPFQEKDNEAYTFEFDPEQQLKDLFIDLEGSIHQIQNNINFLYKAINIIGLGFDFRKFLKFEFFIPRNISVQYGRIISIKSPRKLKITKEQVEFCIQFVIDCALRFQAEELEDFSSFLPYKQMRLDEIFGAFKEPDEKKN